MTQKMAKKKQYFFRMWVDFLSPKSFIVPRRKGHNNDISALQNTLCHRCTAFLAGSSLTTSGDGSGPQASSPWERQMCSTDARCFLPSFFPNDANPFLFCLFGNELLQYYKLDITQQWLSRIRTPDAHMYIVGMCRSKLFPAGRGDDENLRGGAKKRVNQLIKDSTKVQKLVLIYF